MKPAELLTDTHALLGDRARLAIMATLAATKGPIDFATLLDSVNLTKGNLSAHAQKLEEAGLIKVKKEFVGRKPRTTYACTDRGRSEVKNYLSKVEQLLRHTRTRGR
jgi:DNA-binding transcriptional ArsR family regulator